MVYLLFYFSQLLSRRVTPRCGCQHCKAVTASDSCIYKETSLPLRQRGLQNSACEFCTFLGRCFHLTPYGTCCLRHSILEYSNILYLDCQSLFQPVISSKNVNIKFDIFSCFYRFAILHNTQPVLLYIFTFRQRSSKAATAASLSRSLYPLLCKLLYLFLE